MSDLRRTADTYLGDLHRDSQAPTPSGVSEESFSWADAFLAAIRNFREKDVSGEAERAARRFGLSSAKDKLRFFWEFWQNADDAGASTLRFVVGGDQLVVENDGNPFSSRDVYSACFVASSQKAGDISQKGQFGIGFLSLMKVSEAPEVHSGAFRFRLDRSYTYPGALPLDGYFDGTRVVAPLRHDVDSAVLLSELAKRLATEDEILLYMSTLRRVEVYDEAGSCVARIETRAERSRTGAQAIYLGRQRWVQYRTEIETPSDLERDDGEPVAPKIQIILARCNAAVGPHRVSAFFPTNVHHYFPWRFSAPFEVTTNREALLDSDYNRWLLRQVGAVMVEAAIDGAAGDKKAPWSLVPGINDPQNELAALVEAAHSRLKEIAWLPTRGGPMKPEEVAIAASPELKRLIKPADVDDSDVSGRTWLSGDVNDDDRDLLTEMGAYLVCCHELSGVLGTGPNKEIEWYLRAAAETVRLAKSSGYDIDSVYRALADGRCFKDRRGASFSLGQAGREGKVVCNARSENLAEEFSRMTSRSLVLLHRVYRPLERKRRDRRDEDRDEVDAWLRSQSGDKTGFKYEFRLDAPQFIRHFLAADAGETLRDAEQAAHDRLLSFLRDHIGSYQTAYPRDDRLSQVGRNLTVTAFSYDRDGKRVTGRRSINDVYLGRAFSGTSWAITARGVPSLWWLADKYRKLLSREADGMSTMAFLRRLGAQDVPKVLPVAESATHGVYRFSPVSRGSHAEYPHFPHKATGSRWYSAYGTRGDHASPDLDKVLAFIERLPAPARADRGQALLRTIEQSWQSVSSHITARALAYSYNAEYSLGPMPTRWIHSLQSKGWMRFRDGSFRAPYGLIAAVPEAIETLGSRDRDLSAW